MSFKKYQETVMTKVRGYLEALAKEIKAGNTRHAAQDAWRSADIQCSFRNERRNGLDRDLPNFCIKVPTGGGKTLLATQILGDIYKTLLPERNGTGLVLWVVVNDQIYRDVLKAFRDRRHFYREALEFAVSRRIEVWEKEDILRLTPGQLASCLNILVVKLQGTNRKDKESLKFFRDAGGNITEHFSPDNDPDGHRELKKRIKNLDMIEEDERTGNFLCKTSIGNLVRICEPVVILDEAQKVASELARQTIEKMNPFIAVELSATPPEDANVLVQVTGTQLLDEHMIKLPINVQNSSQSLWGNVLTEAFDKRKELAKKAEKHFQQSGRLIRPIVLVQVERTGKEQHDPRYIHSDKVKEYLMQRLGVSEQAIAIKTAQRNDLADKDLLLDDCPIEWIITKAALQEGWDCPFAYILVSLSPTSSKTAMTQLVGRILRQPYQEKTPYDELNESYVFCLRQKAADVVGYVKKALENEGYEGDLAAVIDKSGDSGQVSSTRIAKIRNEFKKHYHKPFQGQIFLPRFSVKTNGSYEALDYYKHLLASIDVEKFNYAEIADWNFAQEIAAAKDQFYRITLGQDYKMREIESSFTESEDAVKAWLVANIGYEWLSAKQMGYIVDRVCERLSKYRDKLYLLKFALLDCIGSSSSEKPGFIQRETDRLAEEQFNRLHNSKRLCFYLDCIDGRFVFRSEMKVRNLKKLRHEDNDEDTQKNLYDYVPDDLNEYERSVALYVDRHPEILWWYRNIVDHSSFSIQGFKRNRIYPDFVIQKNKRQAELPLATILVIESKGKHLIGNADTSYKMEIAKIFEEIGRRITWHDLGEGFDQNCFRFQILDEGNWIDTDWRQELERILKPQV